MNLSMLGLPKDKTKQLESILNFMTTKQKETLFDELDKHQHETTYNDLDDMVCSLESRLEELGEEVDYYHENTAEWMETQRVVYH
jgi:long-subunit acyl-CoA synthetase (AMP-forming)